MASNIIQLSFNGETSVVSEELVYKYDYGQQIEFTDLTLPEYFEVHFSNNKTGKATKQIGHNGVVDIPDRYLEIGSVYGWIFLHNTDSDGETEYEFKIPVKNRAMPSDGEVTPEQESAISQAIAALTSTQASVQALHDETEGYRDDASASSSYAHDAQTAAESAQDAAEMAETSAGFSKIAAEAAQSAAETAQGKAEDAQTAAESAQAAAEAARDDVLGMSAEAETLPAGSSATASYADGVLSLGIPRGDKGETGDTGDTGETGNGIASIDLTSTSGAVKTYTITFTDGTTTTFEVTDGEVTNASMKAYVDPQFADLKSDINEIVIRSNNRFNPNAITENTYINVDGTSTASANFSVTGYIPVTAGETIYWWSKRTDNNYYLFDARFLCAYNSSKVAVSASGSTFVGGSYTVPSGIAYIRLSISNTYLSDWTNFYAGTLTLDEYDEYLPYGEVSSLVNQPQVDENTANIATNTANITKNTNDIESITKASSNLLDVGAITANKYITANGTMGSIATLSVTDYLPVEEGDVIYGWGTNNGAPTGITFRFVCAYNSSKVAVSASGSDSELTPPYTVPSGIAYLRITLRNEVLNYTNLYIGTHAIGVDYEPYGVVVKLPEMEDATYSISNGDSILEAVKYCYANSIKNLIVEAGTYDIISEYQSHYGATYFDDYIDYAQGDVFDAGIWLQNINVKFSAGAKVVCKYTGNNANVPLYFSAFATGNNVEIDGLVLDAENLRYGIHADYNSGTDETFFRVKNCDLKHYKNSTSMQAIGAGFGRHVFWEIENTIFRSAGGNHIVFRVHNNVNSDAQSKLIVKDCYIDGDGYFKFNAYSTSTLQSIIQVCGCSYKTAPVVGRETSDSNDNFTMIAWNNELRS